MADTEPVIDEELDDIEIAELANNELRKKDSEIAKLKKDLAKAKLLSEAEDEVPETMSKEDCIRVISDSNTTNYDYAVAVVNLVDNELAEGKANPLGKNGEQVYNFFKDVIDECGDDKSRFTSIYQARIGTDTPQTAMAYRNRR